VDPGLKQVLLLDPVQAELGQRCQTLKQWLVAVVLPQLPRLDVAGQLAFVQAAAGLLDPHEAEVAMVPEDCQGSSNLRMPRNLLDPSDILLQQVFGHGAQRVVLPHRSVLAFPHPDLALTTFNGLRRLGMRGSNNAAALGFCMEFMASQRRTDRYDAEQYADLQRTIFQKVLEAWQNLADDEAKVRLLRIPFVDTQIHSQATSALDLLPYTGTPKRPPLSRSLPDVASWLVGQTVAGNGPPLYALCELVDRHAEVAPWVSWTVRPLAPRDFPSSGVNHTPTMEDVVGHARRLVGLLEVSVSGEQWDEVRKSSLAVLEKVLEAEEDRTQLLKEIRTTKVVVVDQGYGGTTLVQPWKLSLALKSNRPPLFAVPDYLNPIRDELTALGARDLHHGGEITAEPLRVGGDTMLSLFSDGLNTFSDVTVMAGDRSFYLHRNILMAHCEYFRAMFGSGFQESGDGARAHFLEFSGGAVEVMLRYVYAGSVDDSVFEGEQGRGICAEVLELAHQVDIPYLFEYAQQWLANAQELEDLGEMLQLAALHEAKILESACLVLIGAHRDTPEVQALWPDLSEQHRQAIVSRGSG